MTEVSGDTQPISLLRPACAPASPARADAPAPAPAARRTPPTPAAAPGSHYVPACRRAELRRDRRPGRAGEVRREVYTVVVSIYLQRPGRLLGHEEQGVALPDGDALAGVGVYHRRRPRDRPRGRPRPDALDLPGRLHLGVLPRRERHAARRARRGGIIREPALPVHARLTRPTACGGGARRPQRRRRERWPGQRQRRPMQYTRAKDVLGLPAAWALPASRRLD